MLKVEFDLGALTREQLGEAERTLHTDALAAPQLAPLFTALELAVHEECVIRHTLEERRRIAAALGIDDHTGEWLAGA